MFSGKQTAASYISYLSQDSTGKRDLIAEQRMSQKKRILMIDDHEDTCLMVRLILGQAGYDLTFAYTMTDGLRLARQQPFDLYIIDLWFEDGEGLDLCQQIRAFNLSAPIVVYSADVYPASQAQAMQAGAQAFIPKPSNLEVLTETVQRLLASPQ